MPLDELFNHPTILELRHLGSDEDKALMTGFLLLALQEYCDRNREVGSGKLHHVVLLEEAHNLMEQTPPGSDNAKAAAVVTVSIKAPSRSASSPTCWRRTASTAKAS